jgi:transcription termination/antitermination protein NusG
MLGLMPARTQRGRSLAGNSPPVAGIGIRDARAKPPMSDTLNTLMGQPPYSSIESEPRWHVLWSRSHCEQLVHDQLEGKGFSLFLPKIRVWSRRNGHRHPTDVPMFPGYLFLYHAVDKTSYIEIRKTRGLVEPLGEAWDRLAVIPEEEIRAIQRVHSSRLTVRPHAWLREGERVRITQGLLAGIEGILVRNKLNRGLLVVSIELLQRAVAVEIDCALVSAA